VSAALAASSCTHAPAQIAQVYSQISQHFDPQTKTWSPQWAAFVQALSNDGNRAFDRLYFIHDETGMYFALNKQTWTAVDRPGEFWVGRNDFHVPGGVVPLGTWRAVLVTLDGQHVEQTFVVSTDTSRDPVRAAVTLIPLPANARSYRVEGWVNNYLVWPQDQQGNVLALQKVVGGQFSVPEGASSIRLYSYDKTRAEGLLAGPFSVQPLSTSADR